MLRSNGREDATPRYYIIRFFHLLLAFSFLIRPKVDVHVCEDKTELDRVVFFNSYGDLGMILGLLAANVGLKLGSKGLKVSKRTRAW